VIKLKAEKAALKTELTTRTTAWSQTLAYKKTEEAGRKSYELSRAALSKVYVMSMSMGIRKPKTPMCDSDIDSSHQKPANKMTNSTKTRSSSGQIRHLILMTTSFAIYVLTLELVTNTRNLRQNQNSCSEIPMCDSEIGSSHQKPPN
jgi:hypothetical protein